MPDKRTELFLQVKNYARETGVLLQRGGNAVEELTVRIGGLISLLKGLENIVPNEIYKEYEEFFGIFCSFCERCQQPAFLKENVDDMASSITLLEECMQEINDSCKRKIKKCACCGNEVVYEPLSSYYSQMKMKYGDAVPKGQSETLNKEEYSCPACGCTDRDRLIVSFLKKVHLSEAAENVTRILQIAPAAPIQQWVQINCPHVCYESMDLLMDGVTFKADIQEMNMIADSTYDLIICSHVLEHVQDDRKALAEMKRVLKDDGRMAFLVPVDLKATCIDEEWGCSEEENWRRFGQGDHCRKYNKAGLVERLSEQFYVHSLGKEYFGEDVFRQCGLTDTSTLYVLTKEETVGLDMKEDMIEGENFCTEGPLVSVIMSCYNHGRFVADAIESVIQQSYKNIEFLVADDGSKDDSAEVMKQYSDCFAKEYYFTENIGSRIHMLLKQVQGKYIARINSDDVWHKDKIAMQVTYMEKHPECGACFTWSEYTDEELNPLEETIFIKGNRSRQGWMRYFWEHGNTLCHPSVMMTKEIQFSIPAYGTICWQLPDFFQWVDLIQKTEFYVVPKKLTKMRRHDAQGVANVSAPSLENQIRQTIEEGSVWPLVIKGMENGFFKEAFQELFVDPEAETDEEIMCEKFFLLLKHSNRFVQNGALYYLADVFNDIRECMKDKYHYTKKEIRNTIVEKGLAPLLKSIVTGRMPV